MPTVAPEYLPWEPDAAAKQHRGYEIMRWSAPHQQYPGMTTHQADFTRPPIATELYAHPPGDADPTFDATENVNEV